MVFFRLQDIFLFSPTTDLQTQIIDGLNHFYSAGRFRCVVEINTHSKTIITRAPPLDFFGGRLPRNDDNQMSGTFFDSKVEVLVYDEHLRCKQPQMSQSTNRMMNYNSGNMIITVVDSRSGSA